MQICKEGDTGIRIAHLQTLLAALVLDESNTLMKCRIYLDLLGPNNGLSSDVYLNICIETAVTSANGQFIHEGEIVTKG